MADETSPKKDRDAAEATLAYTGPLTPIPRVVERFRLSVIEGPDAGRAWESKIDRCSIGSHPSNDLVLTDATVSRFHSEITAGERGARIRDLDSKNGTLLDGVQIADAFLRENSLIRMGASVLRFQPGPGVNPLPTSRRTDFGSLVGASVAMRSIFGVLERAAATDATILIEGETGTGKGQMAQSIHRESGRKSGPFMTIDCSAIPANLLESELFGHERGAFSGANERRRGLFEEASGGTVFLDEVGELSPDLQPKLLRVLEDRVIRRVGSNTELPVDVRVIAATNRDLRGLVNLGRFRSDLYYRLAVVKISIPPLRERPEDIELLVEHILQSFGADMSRLVSLRSPEFLAQLSRAPWPGNVRELRNHIERCLVFEDALPMSEPAATASSPEAPRAASAPSVDASLPFSDARKKALEDFERRYLEELLRLHEGKMSKAAGAAGIGRVYLYKLLVRHGLKT